MRTAALLRCARVSASAALTTVVPLPPFNDQQTITCPPLSRQVPDVCGDVCVSYAVGLPILQQRVHCFLRVTNWQPRWCQMLLQQLR